MSTFLALSIFTGCASPQAWKVRDRHGWPVQTWAWTDLSVAKPTRTCIAGSASCVDEQTRFQMEENRLEKREAAFLYRARR